MPKSGDFMKAAPLPNLTKSSGKITEFISVELGEKNRLKLLHFSKNWAFVLIVILSKNTKNNGKVADLPKTSP
jgi:hypothetical protein